MKLLRVSLAMLCVAWLTAFGCGGTNAGAATPTFDGERAMADLRTQCDFGPRAPGTPERSACLTWLKNTLTPLAAQVEDQAFTLHPANGGAGIAGNNVLARFNASRQTTTGALLIGAHWDCRPKADQDSSTAHQSKAVPGANDAASGVAVLLELARLFKQTPPPRPVYLALWDLEDMGQLPETQGMPYLGFCAGSRYFSQNLGNWRPAEAINIDMIGDANLRITREAYSDYSNASLNDKIFAAARRLGYTQFVNQGGQSIIDDHKPLIDVGIPSVDLIDLDYPGPNNNAYWHTLEDTPDKCSAASLKAVGQTLCAVIYGG